MIVVSNPNYEKNWSVMKEDWRSDKVHNITPSICERLQVTNDVFNINILQESFAHAGWLAKRLSMPLPLKLQPCEESCDESKRQTSTAPPGCLH